MKKLIALLLVAVMAFSIISCDQNEAEQATDNVKQETVTKEKEEAEKPNPLAKVVSISLDSYGGKGKCTIYLGDQTGVQDSKSLIGATRALYRTKKSKTYSEITNSSGVAIADDNELLHLIVVFKKGYKLTENDQLIIKDLGLDYMFEK